MNVNSRMSGADNPQGTKFWCQQKPLVTSVICYKFKKNLFEVWFYTHFFMTLYMYIALEQGLTTPWGWNFNANRNSFSIWSFVASLITNLFEVWFYTHFSMILYMYIAPEQGQTASQETKFWCQQKRLVTSFIYFKLKESLQSLILYICFMI